MAWLRAEVALWINGIRYDNATQTIALMVAVAVVISAAEAMFG